MLMWLISVGLYLIKPIMSQWRLLYIAPKNLN